MRDNFQIDSEIILLDEIDTLDRRDIQSIKERNFKEVIRVAAKAVNLLEIYPDIINVETYRDLSSLPVLTGDALAKFCLPSSLGYVFDNTIGGVVLRSSGTSGKSRLIHHSWKFNKQVTALGTRGIKAAFGDEVQKVANLLVPGGLNGASMFLSDICSELPAQSFVIGNSFSMQEVMRIINLCLIETVVGSPRAIQDIVDFGMKNMPTLLNYSYIGAPLGNEAIKELEMYRKNVRSLAYSTSETGPIGYQCRDCSHDEYHVHEDAVIVEIVSSKDGEILKEGLVGAVLVTPLSISGTVLFRYRVGDLAHWVLTPCSCGSKVKKIRLIGRDNSSIIVDSSNISEEQVFESLKETAIQGISDFQFGIEWKRGNTFIAVLRIDESKTLLDTSNIRNVFLKHPDIANIIRNHRCEYLEVIKCNKRVFHYSARDKCPSIYQLNQGEN